MQYEVVQSKNSPGEWRVEAINYDGDGEIYGAIFYGPHAEDRAREYANAENDTLNRAKEHAAWRSRIVHG